MAGEELVGKSLQMQEGKGHQSEGQPALLRSADFALGARGSYCLVGVCV